MPTRARTRKITDPVEQAVYFAGQAEMFCSYESAAEWWRKAIERTSDPDKKAEFTRNAEWCEKKHKGE